LVLGGINAYNYFESKHKNSFGVDTRDTNYVKSLTELQDKLGYSVNTPSIKIASEEFEGAQYFSSESKSANLYYSDKQANGVFYILSVSDKIAFDQFKTEYDKWLNDKSQPNITNYGEVIKLDEKEYYYRESRATRADGQEERVFLSLIWFDNDIYYILNPTPQLNKEQLTSLAFSRK
jgi:hypothetical protein